MKKFLFLFLASAFTVSSFAQEEFTREQLPGFSVDVQKKVQQPAVFKKAKSYSLDTTIVSFLADVSADSVQSHIQHLQNLNTRFCLAPNHLSVRDWVVQKYLSMGITDVVIDSFIFHPYGSTNSVWGYNVVATIPGAGAPDEVVVVGGHYDSYSSGNPMSIAPGADDNASSQACNFEIARVIMERGYVPEKTIKIISFDAEELGLFGSFDYAGKALLANEDIKLMINTDMISNNPGSTNWNVTLNNYTGCDWAVSLAHSLAAGYCALNPVDEYNNSASSDSYPFWEAGFPVLYFEENEFSPNYHSPADILANCNVSYCAEVIRLAFASLLYADNAPSMVLDYTLQDAGTGTSLLAKWSPSAAVDVTGFKVMVGTSSGNYTAEYTTTDTLMLITGLTEGTEYFVGLAAVDADTNLSAVVELSAVPLLIPLAPTGLHDISQYMQLEIGWNNNTENDLLGYNVYRSTTSGSGFVKVNSTPVNVNYYNDPTALIHTFYYYKVSAVDSALNESPLTAEIRARVVSFDQGILVVNDSHGGV